MAYCSMNEGARKAVPYINFGREIMARLPDQSEPRVGGAAGSRNTCRSEGRRSGSSRGRSSIRPERRVINVASVGGEE